MDDAEKKEDLGQEQSPVKDTIGTTEEAAPIAPEIFLEEQPQEAKVEAPKVEQEFIFKFTETEVNLILRGVGELPTKIAYNFVGKILTEVDKQKVPK